jgi:hypothetical protein
MKVEMRGHDNRVEFAAFVPPASIPSIRELIALVSDFHLYSLSGFSAYFYSQRQPSLQKLTY